MSPMLTEVGPSPVGKVTWGGEGGGGGSCGGGVEQDGDIVVVKVRPQLSQVSRRR
jgi:hypothetical protein